MKETGRCQRPPDRTRGRSDERRSLELRVKLGESDTYLAYFNEYTKGETSMSKMDKRSQALCNLKFENWQLDAARAHCPGFAVVTEWVQNEARRLTGDNTLTLNDAHGLKQSAEHTWCVFEMHVDDHDCDVVRGLTESKIKWSFVFNLVAPMDGAAHTAKVNIYIN